MRRHIVRLGLLDRWRGTGPQQIAYGSYSTTCVTVFLHTVKQKLHAVMIRAALPGSVNDYSVSGISGLVRSWDALTSMN